MTNTNDVRGTVVALSLQVAQGVEGAKMALADYVSDKVDGAIADYVARLQATSDAEHAKREDASVARYVGYECAANPMTYVAGRAHRSQRFTKIYTESTYNSARLGGEPDRSVVCFVERSTGLIWKAASWKAPALNFPRGQVFDLPAVIGQYADSGGVLPDTAEGRNAISVRGDA